MFNSSKSSTKQSSEQQTSQATGFQSIATGRGSQVSRDIFGDKNLAKNDQTGGVKFTLENMRGAGYHQHLC